MWEDELEEVLSSLLAKPRFEMSNETAVDDADSVADSSIESKESADITEILTEGFMQSFVPNMESLQGRLGELTWASRFTLY